MWWVAAVARLPRAIQDRWRAVMRLIRQPTQMAIPLQTELKDFLKTVGR
jgi:hypothetical protein